MSRDSEVVQSTEMRAQRTAAAMSSAEPRTAVLTRARFLIILARDANCSVDSVSATYRGTGLTLAMMQV